MTDMDMSNRGDGIVYEVIGNYECGFMRSHWDWIELL